MEVKKGMAVVYIDGLGREKDALVKAVNGAHEGYVSLVHVDINSPEPDNVKIVFDVAHVSNEARQEANPELPNYDVNCWKFYGELHRALPKDHPAFDHPFLEKKRDEQGAIVPVPRPETEAEIAAHKAAMAARPEMPAEAPVEEAVVAPVQQEMAPPNWMRDEHTKERVVAFLASRGIIFKDDGRLLGFLHNLKAHEAKDFRDTFAEWAKQNPEPAPAPPALPAETAPVNTVDTVGGGPMTGSSLPSASDLDAVAAEQQAAAQTSASDADVTKMLDDAGIPPAEPEPPVSE